MEGFEASDAGAFQPLCPVFVEEDFERGHTVNFQDNSSILRQNTDRQQQMAAQKTTEAAHAVENQPSDRTGGLEKYTEMIVKVEEMQKTLATVKETLTQASVQCHMLNVDVVTMFNPEMVETLNTTVEDCETCMRRMAKQVVSTDV